MAYILWLDQPISVTPRQKDFEDPDSINADAIDNIFKVQLAARIELSLSSMIGKHVSVTGGLFEHHTGHHVTEALMLVDSIEVLIE